MEGVKEIKYDIDWVRKENEREFIFFYSHKQKEKGVVDQGCLSQWYPCKFKANGIEYNCAEQFMMSSKALLFNDLVTNEKIMKAKEQRKIKELGREVKNFDKNEWEKKCIEIVIEGNYQKFSQNEELKKFLLNTGDKILVEASPYDKIWGIGMGVNAQNINNPNFWLGTNYLGFCLMEARDRIRKNLV